MENFLTIIFNSLQFTFVIDCKHWCIFKFRGCHSIFVFLTFQLVAIHIQLLHRIHCKINKFKAHNYILKMFKVAVTSIALRHRFFSRAKSSYFAFSNGRLLAVAEIGEYLPLSWHQYFNSSFFNSIIYLNTFPSRDIFIYLL